MDIESNQSGRNFDSESVKANFGPALKLLRENAGLSQSKLAEKAGFDHSYVSRLESGSRFPTREAVDRFAEALGLDKSQKDSFMEIAGFASNGTDLNLIAGDEKEMLDINALLKNPEISEDGRKRLRRLLGEIGHLAASMYQS